jgi:uncharacterized protein YggU (UPF0235/DUF167 family)
MTTEVVRISVKVVAGSSRECIAGWLGDTLRIRVAAAPERGKANAAVEALLARELGLPRGAARIVAGQTSPRKTVEVVGLSRSAIELRLEKGRARVARQPR